MRLLLLSLFLSVTGCAVNSSVKPASTNNGDLTAQWKAAEIAYADKDWRRSYQLYDDLSKSLDDADIEFRKGVSAFRMNQLPLAEAGFTQALKIDPHHRKALFNLAVINLSRGYAYLYEYSETLPEDERPQELEEVLEILERFSEQ